MDTHLTRTLDIAQELCDFCLGPCVYETERRCVACDRPVCRTCVSVVRGRSGAWCPECREEMH